jgi:ribosomal protein S18 acetylase RimI-like enzyme
MLEKPSMPSLVIRLATPEDIDTINALDSFSNSPTRDIHRDIEKYFGSVDPSIHEHTFIFLAEIDGTAAAKAELMLPASGTLHTTGYIKRVVTHPDYRGRGLARKLLQHIIQFARTTHQAEAIDLHVWEGNRAAIALYEGLGFQIQHRELYYRLNMGNGTV